MNNQERKHKQTNKRSDEQWPKEYCHKKSHHQYRQPSPAIKLKPTEKAETQSNLREFPTSTQSIYDTKF